MPIWNASIADSGLSHYAIALAAIIYFKISFMLVSTYISMTNLPFLFFFFLPSEGVNMAIYK